MWVRQVCVCTHIASECQPIVRWKWSLWIWGTFFSRWLSLSLSLLVWVPRHPGRFVLSLSLLLTSAFPAHSLPALAETNQLCLLRHCHCLNGPCAQHPRMNLPYFTYVWMTGRSLSWTITLFFFLLVLYSLSSLLLSAHRFSLECPFSLCLAVCLSLHQ